jgi:hypothetical protein
MDPRFKHPFSCVVSGSSSSGKTQFVLQLLSDKEYLITPSPEKVICCYSEWQSAYDGVNAEFIEGLPNIDEIDKQTRKLMVVDDLMGHNDQYIAKLFTKICHHRNLSVIYITQNLFNANKETRTINLNANYMVLLKNPRNTSQLTHLVKEMYPGRINILREAFHDATKAAYGYLLIDLKPETPDDMRLRTNIFHNDTTVVYVPRI